MDRKRKSDEKLRIQFKKIYRKEPTEHELKTYRKYLESFFFDTKNKELRRIIKETEKEDKLLKR